MFEEMFLQTNKESDLGRALRTNDENFIEEYLDQFKKKKDNELFYILDQITTRRNKEFDVKSVKYEQFVINMMLFRAPDCTAVMSVVNMMSGGWTNQQHYDYLVNNIPVGRKNYRDGTRPYMVENAYKSMMKILICYVYGCSWEVADEYLGVLEISPHKEEFIDTHKYFLETQDGEEMADKYIKHKEAKAEYNKVVEELLDYGRKVRR